MENIENDVASLDTEGTVVDDDNGVETVAGSERPATPSQA
jgi:hypothetical protein